MTRRWLVALFIAGTLPHAAFAQRRGEQGAPAAELNVEFTMAVKFGDTLVPAYRYRVSVSNDSLVLANPDTMEVQATLLASVGDLPAAVAGKADVVVKGSDIQLIVQLGEHSYTVKGQKAAPPVPPKAVEMEAPDQSKRQVDLGETADAPQSAAAKVSQAVQRYLPGLAACIDGAQKAKWITDDPRFSNCVCPVAAKWQMPHLEAPLRMHQKLVKGKFGMSFTVTPDGHVIQCRVWAGARAPEMMPPAAGPQDANAEAPSKT